LFPEYCTLCHDESGSIEVVWEALLTCDIIVPGSVN
jgi:hypothetical protein